MGKFKFNICNFLNAIQSSLFVLWGTDFTQAMQLGVVCCEIRGSHVVVVEDGNRLRCWAVKTIYLQVTGRKIPEDWNLLIVR
jgi:hypothetical protein